MSYPNVSFNQYHATTWREGGQVQDWPEVTSRSPNVDSRDLTATLGYLFVLETIFMTEVDIISNELIDFYFQSNIAFLLVHKK